MADLVITPTSVLKGAGAVTTVPSGFAGETILAGQSVYIDANNVVWKAKNDSAVHAAFLGIALNGGAVGQPIDVQTGGIITIGATVVVGTTYIVSSTFGGIAAIADLASTNFLSYVGYGLTATTLQLMVVATGVQKP